MEFWNSLQWMPTRLLAPTSWTTAARSSREELRPTRSYVFSLKIKLRVSGLPYMRLLDGFETSLSIVLSNGRFLKPFLARLGQKARRRMCPLYMSGLIGPGDRKSIQPMAKRLAFGDYDQLHHFIAAGVWDARAVETELLVQADKLVGGSDALLVIDDTAIAKKGTHSVGSLRSMRRRWARSRTARPWCR